MSMQISTETLRQFVRYHMELFTGYNPNAKSPRRRIREADGDIKEAYCILSSENPDRIGSFTPVTDYNTLPFPSMSKDVPSTPSSLGDRRSQFLDDLSSLGNIWFRDSKIQTLKDRYMGHTAFLGYLKQHPENVLGYSRTHAGVDERHAALEKAMDIMRQENRVAHELYHLEITPEFVMHDRDLLAEAEEIFERPFYALVNSISHIADLTSMTHHWSSKALQRRLRLAERSESVGIRATLSGLQKISELRKQAGYDDNEVTDSPERLIDIGIDLVMQNLPKHLKLYNSAGGEVGLVLI